MWKLSRRMSLLLLRLTTRLWVDQVVGSEKIGTDYWLVDVGDLETPGILLIVEPELHMTGDIGAYR